MQKCRLNNFIAKTRAHFIKTMGEEKERVLEQFLRFSLVGVVNTGVDTGIFSLMFYLVFSGNENLQPVAFVLGYICGLLCSYILNKLWTFKEKSRSLGQIVLFIIVNLVALGAGIGMTELLMGWSIVGVWAKLLTVPVTFLINFIGNKLFVFKNS